LPDPVLGRKHVDLLHPVRRRHRGEWENCRLATVERQLLGIVREDDPPGGGPKNAWLDSIKGRWAGNLRRVAQHNHQDLVSLAALLLRFDGGLSPAVVRTTGSGSACDTHPAPSRSCA